MIPPPPRSTLFPYTTLFRSCQLKSRAFARSPRRKNSTLRNAPRVQLRGNQRDRKSTRLNSSHSQISYAVFCLKKKKQHDTAERQTGPAVLHRVLRHRVAVPG